MGNSQSQCNQNITIPNTGPNKSSTDNINTVKNNYIKTEMSIEEYQIYLQFLKEKKSQNVCNRVPVENADLFNLDHISKENTRKIQMNKSLQNNSKDNTFNQNQFQTNQSNQYEINQCKTNQYETNQYKNNSKNYVNHKYTNLTNERHFSVNLPKFTPDRVQINMQNDNVKQSKINDNYQDFFQKRQQEGNETYLNTLKKHGNVSFFQKKFEITQLERERLKESNQKKNVKQYNLDKTYQNNKLNVYPSLETNLAKQETRKSIYLNRLKHFEKNEDPYHLLGISKDSNLSQVKQAYYKLAKDVHPDKGGNSEMFNQLTKAYLLITKKKNTNGKTESNNYQKMRSDFKEYSNEQSSGKQGAPLGKGQNFNKNLFNEMFINNKLHNVNDDGYKEWIESNNISDIDIKKDPAIIEKFNINVFNSLFDNSKKKEKNQIIKISEPSAINQGNIGFSELGTDQIDDFGKGQSINNNKTLFYTDYKQAMTNTVLINTNDKSLHRKSYRDVEELEKVRDTMELKLDNQELQEYNRIREMEKINEQKRIVRLEKNDQEIEKNYQRINNLLK